MSRSQLLKDVVAGVNIETILLRLKVILSDLNNELESWVIGELEGYNKIEDLPPYRIIKGIVKGTYFVNYNVQYTNQMVPLKNLIKDDSFIEDLQTCYMMDSVSILSKIATNKSGSYIKKIPTEVSHGISTEELQVTSMYTDLPLNLVEGISLKIKSKLVDVIMILESEYDNLDDLDISSQIEENPSKAKDIIIKIENVLFDDSIKIGDKNKIKRSKLGNIFGGSKNE